MQLNESCCAANFYATFQKQYFVLNSPKIKLFWEKKRKIFERKPQISPSPIANFWLRACPFYDIFAPQKVPFLKNFDDVIACDLWFGPPPPYQKSWLRLCLKL